MKPILTLVVMIVLVASGVVAQEETPTPSFGSVLDGVPAASEAEATAVVPGADARTATCAAPTLPDFVPYIIRAGDRLADLLTGVDNLTVSQLATLNCLDDPSALPIGATIWIPRPSVTATTVQAETTDEVGGEEAVEDAQAAEILLLSASAETVLNQEGVTFSWEARGAEAYFYACPADPDIECSRPVQAQPQPLASSLIVSEFQYAGPARFRLDVVGGENRLTQDLIVEVECSQEALGLVSGYRACPEMPPIAVFAAWQPFENGVMVYFSDTEEIYVMTNADNRVQVFPNTFVEGMTDADVGDVPDQRFPARRGFGIVWQALGGPDSALGWALAEEIGFDAARQPAGRVSYTTYVKGPGDVVYAVTLVPDLGEGYWLQIKG